MGAIPTRMMPIGVWTPPPPYDSEVEFVESTGEQYVNTGVAITPAHRVEADFQFTRVDVRQQRIFEQYERDGHLFVAYYENSIGNVGFAWSHVTADWKSANAFGPMNTNRLVYAMDGPKKRLWKGSAYVSLPSVDDNGPGETTLTLGSKDLNVKPTHGRWFGARIILGSVLVRDFIPVRVGTEGALFDRANPTGGPLGNGLYGSATSTPLVAGPDKT